MKTLALIQRYLLYARNLMASHRYAYLDKTANVSPAARIIGAKNLSVGAHTTIHAYATLQASPWNKTTPPAGRIILGDHCAIQSYAYLWTNGGDITIGHHCSINPYCCVYGHGGLTIGNYVRIAPHAVIIPGNHNFERLDIPISRQGSTLMGIEIGNDIWIGAGVMILDGVHIADGCVIGAGSVVTHSTEPNGVYVGAPARRIKDRTPENTGSLE